MSDRLEEVIHRELEVLLRGDTTRRAVAARVAYWGRLPQAQFDLLAFKGTLYDLPEEPGEDGQGGEIGYR